ncbi:MAG: ATP-binding cassette domain-containing protein [Planctomycetaceae bacterium]|jgi:putative ABC transport system ATP-binding protein|nr:ATP-binding cassette domain-containing protein [Planctomycetaceae bacterium]
MQNSKPIITAENLIFRYPRSQFKLEFPKLEVAVGTHCVITGPSGCGKTTWLRLLSGIESAQTGEITIKGRRLSKLTNKAIRTFRNQNFGFIFQDFRLVEYLSLRDNILLGVMLGSKSARAPAISRLDELASRVGIADLLPRRVIKLSRGEMQRVAVCRALIHNPAVIFADEPTANLDPKNRDIIWDLINSEARVNDATVLAVSHDTDSIGRFDKVVELDSLMETAAS